MRFSFSLNRRSSAASFLLATCLAGLTGHCLAAQLGLPAGATVEVGFSPHRQSQEIVLKGVESAQKSILVAAYSFTSKPIAIALLEAYKRGVKVEVVADKKANTGKYSAVTFLANQGVPVRLNDRYAIHHNKFMVFDSVHVETGSFNYSAAAADKNAENVLLLWNVPAVAKRYSEEWQRLWDEAKPVQSNY